MRLADNALGHGATRLEIAAGRDGDALRSVVSEGVSPADRNRAFDSFFTPRRDSGGTGMGLAIVCAKLEA